MADPVLPPKVPVWPCFVALIGLIVTNIVLSIPIGIVALYLLHKEGGKIEDAQNTALLMERFPNLMTGSMVIATSTTVLGALIAFAVSRQSVREAVRAPSRLRPGVVAALALVLASWGYSSFYSWLILATGHFQART